MKPENVHYELHDYTDPNQPLVQSDLGRLALTSPSLLKHGAGAGAAASPSGGEIAQEATDGEGQHEQPSKFRFLIASSA